MPIDLKYNPTGRSRSFPIRTCARDRWRRQLRAAYIRWLLILLSLLLWLRLLLLLLRTIRSYLHGTRTCRAFRHFIFFFFFLYVPPFFDSRCDFFPSFSHAVAL